MAKSPEDAPIHFHATMAQFHATERNFIMSQGLSSKQQATLVQTRSFLQHGL
jgi:hypothetical protein